MGGRGASSGSGRLSSGGMFRSEGSVELTNERSRSSGNRWKHDILEASNVGGGELKLSYAQAQSYDRPNSNTTVASYKLEHGMWSSQPGDRSPGEVGINWDKVTSVSGQTFAVKSRLREEGFRWDGKDKKWVKRD